MTIIYAVITPKYLSEGKIRAKQDFTHMYTFNSHLKSQIEPIDIKQLHQK